MSKVEKLLKQAEFFERLAVYSDRATFLKRLAQTKPVDDSAIYQALKALESGLVSWKRKNRNGTTELPSVVDFTSQVYRAVDSELPLTEEKLSQLDAAAKSLGSMPSELTDPQEKKDWFDMVTGPASQLDKLIEEKKQYATDTFPPVDQEHTQAINLPTQELSGPNGRSISKQLQAKLNSLLNEQNGKPIPGKKPIAVDGILGPETQAALDELNQTYYKGHLSKDQILEALQEL